MIAVARRKVEQIRGKLMHAEMRVGQLLHEERKAQQRVDFERAKFKDKMALDGHHVRNRIRRRSIAASMRGGSSSTKLSDAEDFESPSECSSSEDFFSSARDSHTEEEFAEFQRVGYLEPKPINHTEDEEDNDTDSAKLESETDVDSTSIH